MDDFLIVAAANEGKVVTELHCCIGECQWFMTLEQDTCYQEHALGALRELAATHKVRTHRDS